MGNKKSKLKFKVIGSYTIQTFYSKEFEIEDKDNLDQQSLIEMVGQIAHADEWENGLKDWKEDWSKVIGDNFYIDEVIPQDANNLPIKY